MTRTYTYDDDEYEPDANYELKPCWKCDASELVLLIGHAEHSILCRKCNARKMYKSILDAVGVHLLRPAEDAMWDEMDCVSCAACYGNGGNYNFYANDDKRRAWLNCDSCHGHGVLYARPAALTPHRTLEVGTAPDAPETGEKEK